MDVDSDSLICGPIVDRVVAVSFRDAVYVTSSPEIVEDSSSNLIESVVVTIVNDINCSDVVGRSISVDSGSIVGATGDLVIIKVDSIAFDS
jgi:hypothetical protein